MASKVSAIERPNDVPEKIGKYVIINKIGKGSTGTVYLSHDPYYRRDVAIKVYNLEEDADAERAKVSRKMFFNEAHMVDNLLRVDDVVEIIYKCAKALHYAHGRGVIHRDIKPSNVMLTIDNDVRIIDFGIAIVSDSDVSRIEGIAGSPSYMSPEQVQSEELTPRSDLYSLGAVRSDLYSLGAVMYELLTGFRPFRADNLSKLLHQIVYATPPPIHTYRDDLPEELEHVVMTTMQKDPGKRLVTGNAMAAELTRVYKDLRQKYDSLDNQEHFDLLRTLHFFHEFSHAEIWEVLRASDWHEYRDAEDIVREGEVDDRFYIIVAGNVEVQANGETIGTLGNGDCFGETSYVRGAKRQASIRANGQVTILRVSSTLMEQVSSACQLRFNKVFLRSLITRLQGSGGPNT
ncbi:MAG: serine/threonine-protein kinase [Woeseiaceae bacterium]